MVYIVAGPEFGSLEVHKLLIDKVLHGLRSYAVYSMTWDLFRARQKPIYGCTKETKCTNTLLCMSMTCWFLPGIQIKHRRLYPTQCYWIQYRSSPNSSENIKEKQGNANNHTWYGEQTRVKINTLRIFHLLFDLFWCGKNRSLEFGYYAILFIYWLLKLNIASMRN